MYWSRRLKISTALNPKKKNGKSYHFNQTEEYLGCAFVLDRTDFLVIVFVVAPVFFGARTKNMIRKSVPSSTKTEQLFCVACITSSM
jgi:hypothetical protein